MLALAEKLPKFGLGRLHLTADVGCLQALRKRNHTAMEALRKAEQREKQATADLEAELASRDTRIRDLELKLSEQSEEARVS